jgi:hypothetical protein
MLAHIAMCLISTPTSLGDPKKDTPEELEERHERVLTASLSAAAALLTMMQQAAQQQGPPDQPGSSSSSSGADSAATAAAAQEVQEKVSEMVAGPGFFKQKLGSKSAVVRRAAYGFIQAVCSAVPQLLKPCLAAAAPAVMGALQVGGGQGPQDSSIELIRTLPVFAAFRVSESWSVCCRLDCAPYRSKVQHFFRRVAVQAASTIKLLLPLSGRLA